MVIHVDKPDAQIREIVAKTFPGYSGKKFKVNTDYIPSRLDSYWDGGSRTQYCFYNLASKKSLFVASNHPYFEREKPREFDPETLPAAVVLVAHSIFCGKDMGITIYAKPEAVAPLLPAPTELTLDQKIVLTFTKGLKPSYAGISNYRLHEAHKVHRITKDRWENAKAECIAAGYLNKAGAITAAGRNVIQGQEVSRY